MSKARFLLFESPTGYGLFKRDSDEEIGAADVELQKSLNAFSQFNDQVSLVGFAPFQSPENALEDCICISEGLMSDFLKEFLSTTLAKKAKKEAGWELAVSDPKLGSAIAEALGFNVVSNESVTEFLRLIRRHCEKLLPDHQKGDISRAQCGLGHAFSRNKVKFNVHRSDNMIIQASALLEHMDGGVNQLGMRVKEWYGWHFPEMGKEIADPVKYARVALLLGPRATLHERDEEEVKQALLALLDDDETQVGRVYEKAVTSMGGDLAEVDWVNVKAFAERVVSLADYRTAVQQYLVDKMMAVAPNLTQLMGQNIGAKLISKAGSLTSLAKAPASTIQILGAEKALFRALKKRKGNTPKYGLIFHSTFIQRAAKENRGKISRYLANKTALACRIDCFMEQPPTVFGDKLREQVEGRLNFFDSGEKPQSNTAAMKDALEAYYAVLKKQEKKSKKAAREEAPVEEKPKKKRRVEDSDSD